MATYNKKYDRTTNGIKKVKTAKKSSYERSLEDIREGRIEKFASSEEMFKSLGL